MLTSLEICQKQRNEIREERDAALAEVANLISLLCELESALIDAPNTAEVRLARIKVSKAITGNAHKNLSPDMFGPT